MASSKFKEDHSFVKRKAEADRIRQKYADRIPIICDRAHTSDINKIDKTKYLVPADLTVGQFVFVIRKRIELSHEQALFLFVQDELASASSLMSQVYEQHKDEDGFLYITYSGESTFGIGPTDLPVEIWDSIIAKLDSASKIRLALTCKSLLVGMDPSRSLRNRFRCIKESPNNRRRHSDDAEPCPRWRVLETARWALLEHLEDSRWKCCSTCLKLHPVGHFPSDQVAKPPKERYCRLGDLNGLVSLCQCITFSFHNKTDLIAKLKTSGGQWADPQAWHKCVERGPSSASRSFDFHVQLRPQLGPQGQLRIETTLKLATHTFGEPVPSFENLFDSRFACPHCTILSFVSQVHPIRKVPRNMAHNFGDIVDSSGTRKVRLDAKWFMTCPKCQTTIIDYGALGPDAAGTRSYYRTVRDLGSALDRPDQTWYRQTSTSLEGLQTEEQVERDFYYKYTLGGFIDL